MLSPAVITRAAQRYNNNNKKNSNKKKKKKHSYYGSLSDTLISIADSSREHVSPRRGSVALPAAHFATRDRSECSLGREKYQVKIAPIGRSYNSLWVSGEKV